MLSEPGHCLREGGGGGHGWKEGGQEGGEEAGGGRNTIGTEEAFKDQLQSLLSKI